MAMTLEGQVAIVTGAGRGFGRAVAVSLAAEGAAVAVASRTRTQLDETVRHIETGGGRGFAIAGDVTQRRDVAFIVAAAEKHFGPVTLLVNNAGVPDPFGPVSDIDPDQWWAAQAVHVYGPLLFMRAVLPGMKQRRAGRIINVSAYGGTVVAPCLSAYCVGKAAQN
ncbi:MAG: SDR family NAD(P)-dependent oxidoreductase, partial [Gammaproteobacteria bacterium]